MQLHAIPIDAQAAGIATRHSHHFLLLEDLLTNKWQQTEISSGPVAGVGN